MDTTEDRRAAQTRGGRRKRGGAAALKTPFLARQLEWAAATYLDSPAQPMDAEGVEAIHDASMQVLEDIGILFMNDEALAILRAAGCDVDMTSQRVRMDRDFVMEAVGKAPSQFTITPRNPQREITMGGRHFNFGQVASAPNVMDLDEGRRVGTRADFQNLLRLSQSFNCIHFNSGYPVEPVDIHASIRHLDAIQDRLMPLITEKRHQLTENVISSREMQLINRMNQPINVISSPRGAISWPINVLDYSIHASN